MSRPLYSWRLIHPKAHCHYIRDVHQANILVGLLRGPVGFDLEWRPSFQKGQPENPVALVQLANEETILLIQVSAMQEFPTGLQEFLENSSSAKVGVGIQYDAKKLYRDCQVSIRNCVDLSLLARSADNEQWKGRYSSPIGLARLVEAYEDRRLSKGKTSRSDWQSILNSTQQEYAANDAHAAYVIYTKLMTLTRSMTAIPKSVYYTFDAVRGRLCEPSGMYWYAFNPDYDPGPLPPIVPKEDESSTSNSPIPQPDTASPTFSLPTERVVVTEGSSHRIRRLN